MSLPGSVPSGLHFRLILPAREQIQRSRKLSGITSLPSKAWHLTTQLFILQHTHSNTWEVRFEDAALAASQAHIKFVARVSSGSSLIVRTPGVCTGYVQAWCSPTDTMWMRAPTKAPSRLYIFGLQCEIPRSETSFCAQPPMYFERVVSKSL